MEYVFKKFLDTIQKYKDFEHELESKKRYFGEVELSPNEIHTLVYISKNQNFNTTDLAKKLNITKVALGKTAKKLEVKNCIIRYFKKDNMKSIYYKLTLIGNKAVLSHKEFHKKIDINMSDELLEFIKANERILLKNFEYTNNYIDKLMDIVKKG